MQFERLQEGRQVNYKDCGELAYIHTRGARRVRGKRTAMGLIVRLLDAPTHEPANLLLVRREVRPYLLL